MGGCERLSDVIVRAYYCRRLNRDRERSTPPHPLGAKTLFGGPLACRSEPIGPKPPPPPPTTRVRLEVLGVRSLLPVFRYRRLGSIDPVGKSNKEDKKMDDTLVRHCEERDGWHSVFEKHRSFGFRDTNQTIWVATL